MAMLNFGFPDPSQQAPSSGPLTDIYRSAVAYRQNAGAAPGVIEEAVRRLQAIGSERAGQMAQLVQRDPRTAQAMVQDAGGWSNYVAQLEAEARERQAGQATADALAQSGMPQFSALAQISPGAAVNVAQLFQRSQPQAQKPQYKMVLDPETRQWVYRDVTQGGNYVAPGPYGTQMSVDPKTGEVQFASGPGVGGASSADATVATKPTINKLQEKQVNINENIARLDQIDAMYDENSLRALGQLGNKITSTKDWLGMDIDPEQQAALESASQMKQAVTDNVSRYILEMSGKAATDAERAFLQQVQVSMDDPPVVFQAKLKNLRRYSQALAERNMYYLRSGRIEELGSGDAVDPNKFRKLKEKRGRTLYAELQKQNPGKSAEDLQDAVIDRLAEELNAGMPWE